MGRAGLGLAGLPLAGLLPGLTGCATEKKAAADGPRPWHHLPDGRFRNPPGSPRHSVSFSKIVSHISRHMGGDEYDMTPPPGHLLTPEATLEGLRNLNGGRSLTWLGHSSFLIRLAGRTLLLDPFLSTYASPVSGVGPRRYVAPPLRADQLPQVDVLVVSHNHYDHLDEAVVESLPGKTRTTVIAPLGLGGFFRDRGYTDIRELDWNGSTAVGDLTITGLPAIHFSRRGLGDGNTTLWSGWSLAGEGLKIYYSGDTAYGPVFRDIGRDHGPFDLGLVTIGAYHPREMFGASHASPEEAAQMCLDLGIRRAVGMHWGVIRLTGEPPYEPGPRFTEAARKAGLPKEAVWRMAIGQTRPLPV